MTGFGRVFFWAASLSVAMIASGQAQVAAPAATEETESMAEVMLGDHWSYEHRDNITGQSKNTFTTVVTDISANDISVRYNSVSDSGVNYLTYDRNWNLQSSSSWKFSPHDGTGVQLPLTVGKTWKMQAMDSNTSGARWKRIGSSKVVAEEKVTTAGGTFNTVKIETSINLSNPNNPARKTQIAETTWYSPAVNHWVKRTSKATIDGKVRENTTIELVDYGRR